MKTGMGLLLIGVGAILAFAVTTNTSVFNLHTAGYVIMLVGIIGLVIPRRSYGRIGKRLTVRRPGTVEEITIPHYTVRRDPGDSRVKAGLPSGSGDYAGVSPDTRINGETIPTGTVPGETVRRETEVIEDVYEE
jgi:hypothetical protein